MMPRIGTREHSTDTSESRLDLPWDFVRVDLDGMDDPVSRIEMLNTAETQRHIMAYLWDFQASDVGRLRDAAPDNISFALADSESAHLTALPGLASFAGTDGAFAQLNRERPAPPADGEVVYTISPTAHDTDDETMIENLLGVRATSVSARALYPHTPVGLGLLELSPHFNPAAGDRASNQRRRRVDSRIGTGFCLAWLFGALCELAAGGIARVTVLEADGPYGFLQGETLIPATHLIADLSDAGLIGRRVDEAGQRSIGVVLPPSEGPEARRYAMRIGPAREDAPGQALFLASNLGGASWMIDPMSEAMPPSLRQAARLEARIVTHDATPIEMSRFAGAREEMTRALAPHESVELPPRSYLWLRGGQG
jgi:hypothetical protein